jgi:hypothetical protein
MLLRKNFFKLLSIYLAFAMMLISLPSQGWAIFIPAGQGEAVRQADLHAVQKALESTVVKQRLMDYGLTPEEAMARINALSDEQVHQFALRLDSLQAGADDGVGAIIFLLLVAIIVIVVLEVTGHRVIVR